MLDISEIRKQFPESLHKFDRGIIREYLQYHILGIIFSHKLSLKLSFLGGTCLRIAHGLKRFSEYIDFDNKTLTEKEFEELGLYIKKELEKLGFTVEIKFVNKEAFHCLIRFPRILFDQGLSPIEEEKIFIRIDTFDQGVYYSPDTFILNKFEVFRQIFITPKNVILSQKLWTITQRNRLKGRDFYDIMFLLQNTKPDQIFLKAKFGTADYNKLIVILEEKLKETDYEALAKDVQPFLFNEEAKEMFSVFPTFLRQQLLN